MSKLIMSLFIYLRGDLFILYSRTSSDLISCNVQGLSTDMPCRAWCIADYRLIFVRYQLQKPRQMRPTIMWIKQYTAFVQTLVNIDFTEKYESFSEIVELGVVMLQRIRTLENNIAAARSFIREQEKFLSRCSLMRF